MRKALHDCTTELGAFRQGNNPQWASMYRGDLFQSPKNLSFAFYFLYSQNKKPYYFVARVTHDLKRHMAIKAVRGSEGYDFTPILTHYVFLLTTILAIVG